MARKVKLTQSLVAAEDQVNIAGDGIDPVITGNALNNLIVGHRLDETIRGLGGNDTIYGGLGIDTIDGGDGDDVIIGSEGADILTGGAGSDTFRWVNWVESTQGNPSGESITTPAAIDTIMDFDPLQDMLEVPVASFDHIEIVGDGFIVHSVIGDNRWDMQIVTGALPTETNFIFSA